MARKRGVDRAQVVAAAVAVVEADGLDALTLARVAGELDVRSPSLYSHVANLGALRREVSLEAARGLGAALAGAVAAAGPADHAAALRCLAVAYRAFARASPGLYAAMLPVPGAADDQEAAAVFAAPVGTVAGVLAALGVPEADLVPTVRAVRSALHGFVTLEGGGGFGLPVDVDASFELLVDLLVDGVRARR